LLCSNTQPVTQKVDEDRQPLSLHAMTQLWLQSNKLIVLECSDFKYLFIADRKYLSLCSLSIAFCIRTNLSMSVCTLFGLLLDLPLICF
jgi:hypothetical protein